MRILTADEMRAADRAAIDEWGIPGLVLMENAALGVVEAICDRYATASDVLVVCGPGNNGGDGLAVARHLALRGFAPRILLLGWRRNRSPDAQRQLEICERQGLPLIRVESEEELAALRPGDWRADLWVDAIFGTGLARPLEGVFAGAVAWLSTRLAPVVSVDLPSGLDASTGELIGPAVTADLTVTFAAPKRAHVFAPAAAHCGDVAVSDLGVPDEVIAQAPGGLHLLTAAELRGRLRPIAADDHKGSFGHCLLVAGSTGKAGAALLAARAAVAAGAGLVTVAVPEPLATAVDTASLESMTLPLPADLAGGLTRDAADEVLAALEGKSCLAIGPGLGRGDGTVAAVERILEHCALPLVVDADALNALDGRVELLAQRAAPTLLTPHPGEAARLFGSEVGKVQGDRIGFALRASAASRACLVLKGYQTLVASDGQVFVNPTGNPGMASGGSGDVLTGLIAALLACHYDPVVAACLGVYVHGLAGDLALETRGVEGLHATDLLHAIPEAFVHLRRG